MDLEQAVANYSSWGHLLVLEIKLYWHTATIGCGCMIMAELSGCDRGQQAYKILTVFEEKVC